MLRIDDRTVELTDEELACKAYMDARLDEGMGVSLAAKLALNAHRVLDVEFIEYLSDGTCHLWGDRVLIKPRWRL